MDLSNQGNPLQILAGVSLVSISPLLEILLATAPSVGDTFCCSQENKIFNQNLGHRRGGGHLGHLPRHILTNVK